MPVFTGEFVQLTGPDGECVPPFDVEFLWTTVGAWRFPKFLTEHQILLEASLLGDAILTFTTLEYIIKRFGFY